MHAHSYLATLPFYMLAMIAVINWPVVLDLLRLDWQGQPPQKPNIESQRHPSTSLRD